MSFLTTLDNEVAMSCSVEYMSKASKTDEYMTGKFKFEAKARQICQRCLSQANTVEHIIDMEPNGSDCLCKECWHNKVMCDSCTRSGFLFPACRARAKCLNSG